jgi:hypothetical protein
MFFRIAFAVTLSTLSIYTTATATVTVAGKAPSLIPHSKIRLGGLRYVANADSYQPVHFAMQVFCNAAVHWEEEMDNSSLMSDETILGALHATVGVVFEGVDAFVYVFLLLCYEYMIEET